MKTLLVAERMNIARRPSMETRCETDPHSWLEVSVRIGCFGTGLSTCDGPGERRLRELLGLRYDDALNLLPPHPRCGAWCAYTAARCMDALVDLHRAACATLVSYGPDHLAQPGMRLSRWAYDCFVFVGRRVESAAGPGGFQYCVPRLTCDGNAATIVVPHPSGQNRWWNDATEVRAARERLRTWYEANAQE